MNTIELNKTVGVVDIPRGCYNYRYNGNILFYDICNGVGYDEHYKIVGTDWQILSLHSEMTEEKLKEADIIPNIGNHLTIIGDAFPDYMDDDCMFFTLLESYQSWIKSLGYVTKNPLGEKPKVYDKYDWDLLEKIKIWEDNNQQVVELVILIKEG